MKVLVIHNFHRKGSASGDDQVFKNETKLLEQNGVEVVRYSVSNDSFDNIGLIGKLSLTFGMLWSGSNYKAVRKLCLEEKPDLVHVHTFFPLLSPSILYAAKKSGVPVVATLHDTRFICPCATSLCGTQICNKCGDGHYLRMVKYGCFKGSKVQSLIVAMVFRYHRNRKSFYRQIDKYICLNLNQIKLLENIGFDRDKIVQKYNFVEDYEQEETGSKTASLGAMKDVGSKNTSVEEMPDRYAVFFGRIGEEKGIRNLMKIWERISDIPLVVMGGGPLEVEFREWADKQDNVYFLGYTKHDICMSIVSKGEFVVFPSIWYEGCSMVEIEAESMGKALITTDLGFSAEAIVDGFNGLKVPLGDVEGFAAAIRELWKNPEKCAEMGRNARKDYEEKYMPHKNIVQLMDIYESVIGGKADN